MPELDEIGPFLRARWDEAARLAREAGAESWSAASDHLEGVTGFDALHIAAQDPARTLRRIEGLRKVLDAYEGAARIWAKYPERHDTSAYYWQGQYSALGDAVRFAALEFQDHLGYQESWRPT